MSLREDDYQKEVPDEPVTILMENVESVYIGTAGRAAGMTVICMKSGDSFTLRDQYKDIVEIWRTCIEPININQ
jgi:hypothetical protein